MKEYLKFGNLKPKRTHARGFVFSMGAVISLLACVLLVALLSAQSQEDFSDVLVYKQASDLLEVMLEDGSLETRDVAHLKLLLHSVGLKGKITLGKEVLIDENPYVLSTVKRTMITKDGEYVAVTLDVGK